MSWRVAVDIGGGFTDLFALNQKTGEIICKKVESTPPDYERAVIEILSDVPTQEVLHVIHGQTVVENAILTRNIAKTGLMQTNHFDALSIGRGNRRDMLSPKYLKREPIVARSLTVGINERVSSSDGILKPLNESEIRDAARRLIDQGVESIAISFIDSYVNPVHEQKAGNIVVEEMKRKGKEPFVTIGHELTRVWREFERTSTAILNACTMPIFATYISKLEKAMEDIGLKGSFYVMLGNAGLAVSSFAKRYPISTLLGGPIAGLVGGVALGQILGETNMIVLDGGSTTTKAGLIKDLVLRIGDEFWIDDHKYREGYPVKVPVVETAEVGSGGTSIVWKDDLGHLHVGPQAAGAEPGPAAYGKGGEKPTLTDAYIVLGLLNPRYHLGGKIKVSLDLARKALKPLSDFYDSSIEELSDAVVKIANERASYVIKLVSIQKGYDTRDFSLIAHGGSGPMFAPFIASELEISKIIVPAVPAGVFNCWGMLTADIKHDLRRTLALELNDKNYEEIMKTFKDMEKELVSLFTQEDFDPDKVILTRYADMRYVGQEWYLHTPVMGGNVDVRKVRRRFAEIHQMNYEFTLPKNPVEIVNFHVSGVVKMKKPQPSLVSGDLALEKALIEERETYQGRSQDFLNIPVYNKELIPVGVVIEGPSIIEEDTSTVLVLAGFRSKRDKYGNIIIWKKD